MKLTIITFNNTVNAVRNEKSSSELKSYQDELELKRKRGCNSKARASKETRRAKAKSGVGY